MSQNSPPERLSEGARQIEHTADLALEVWGPDEPRMLQAAAIAVVEILTDDAVPAGDVMRTVALEAIDAEDRLVRWLSEVLYWASVDGFVVARAELQVVPGGLRGRAFGLESAKHLVKTEIKAATYHDLHVEEGDGLVRARVVLDV
jgi:SHS2 domain-containing protein